MATTTQTVTATTSTSTSAGAVPASSAAGAADPIRVERGHRAAWIVTGVAVVLLSTAGIVAARTATTSEAPAPSGSAVARIDAVESAHGQGSSIRTAAGPAVAAVPALSTATAPVVHRTPPKGMADAAATTTAQRSEGPRNVQPGQPLS